MTQIVKGLPPVSANHVECVRIRLRLPHDDRCIDAVWLIRHEIEADESGSRPQLREELAPCPLNRLIHAWLIRTSALNFRVHDFSPFRTPIGFALRRS